MRCMNVWQQCQNEKGCIVQHVVSMEVEVEGQCDRVRWCSREMLQKQIDSNNYKHDFWVAEFNATLYLSTTANKWK